MIDEIDPFIKAVVDGMIKAWDAPYNFEEENLS